MQIYNDFPDVSPEVIPSIISSKFDELSELKKKVKESREKADQARNSAERASEKSAGLFQKKEAIESLQEATCDLAESQAAMVEAQETTFKYQEKIAKIMQFLFALGISNIAAHRVVIRELELRLKGASEEEIDDLTRNEIVNVVKQLKKQEDIMRKQEELSKRVKKLESDLADSKEKNELFSSQIQTQMLWNAGQDKKWKVSVQKEEQQDNEIENIKQRNIEFERLLAESAAKDKSQDKALIQQMKESEKHDRLLAEQAAKDEKLEKAIIQQLEKNREWDVLISECKVQDDEQQALLNKQTERITALLTSLAEHGDKLVVQSQSIENLSQVLERQEKMIQETQTTIAKISEQIDVLVQEKSDKKQVMVAYVIATVALITAIIQFFI